MENSVPARLLARRSAMPLTWAAVPKILHYPCAVPKIQPMVCKITRDSASSTVLSVYVKCGWGPQGTWVSRSVTHVPNSELTELQLQCLLESNEDRSFSKPAWVVIVC